MSPAMRRKNQALPPPDCDAILTAGSSGVLALCGEEGWPYALPISYAYHQAAGRLYFHCALEGSKLRAIARDCRASFCVIGEDQVVPERFTTHYRSVIAYGRMRTVEDTAEKLAAIRLLAEKYSPLLPAEAREEEIRRGWDRLCVLAMDLTEITGKEAIELARARQAGEGGATEQEATAAGGEQAAQARRARSIRLLEAEGIPCIRHLPCIEAEDTARLRDREEIVRRAGCLFLTCLCIWSLAEEAGGIEKATREMREECGEYYRQIAESWGLLRDLSGEELALLDGRADRRRINALSWRFEAFRVLAWALTIGPELDLPREQFDWPMEDFFPNLEPDALEKFRQRAVRRSPGELLDQADLIYRVRWALVEAGLHQQEPPAGLDGDVAMERHIALNWLIGYGGEDWDSIRIDT